MNECKPIGAGIAVAGGSAHAPCRDGGGGGGGGWSTQSTGIYSRFRRRRRRGAGRVGTGGGGCTRCNGRDPMGRNVARGRGGGALDGRRGVSICREPAPVVHLRRRRRRRRPILVVGVAAAATTAAAAADAIPAQAQPAMVRRRGRGGARGRAVQIDPMKPTLKAPGTKRLKLQYDEPPSNFAFKFISRRYTGGAWGGAGAGMDDRSGSPADEHESGEPFGELQLVQQGDVHEFPVPVRSFYVVGCHAYACRTKLLLARGGVKLS